MAQGQCYEQVTTNCLLYASSGDSPPRAQAKLRSTESSPTKALCCSKTLMLRSLQTTASALHRVKFRLDFA